MTGSEFDEIYGPFILPLRAFAARNGAQFEVFNNDWGAACNVLYRTSTGDCCYIGLSSPERGSEEYTLASHCFPNAEVANPRICQREYRPLETNMSTAEIEKALGEVLSTVKKCTYMYHTNSEQYWLNELNYAYNLGRIDAVEHFSGIPTRNAAQLVLRVAEDKDPLVKLAAIKAISGSGILTKDEKAHVFSKLLSHSLPFVCDAAREALQQLESPEHSG